MLDFRLRNITDKEDPKEGIYAGNEDSSMSIERHLSAGNRDSTRRDSPWISTTASFGIIAKLNKRNRVVLIDMDKVETEVENCMHRKEFGVITRNEATANQRTLIKGHIPADGIVVLLDEKDIQDIYNDEPISQHEKRALKTLFSRLPEKTDISTEAMDNFIKNGYFYTPKDPVEKVYFTIDRENELSNYKEVNTKLFYAVDIAIPKFVEEDDIYTLRAALKATMKYSREMQKALLEKHNISEKKIEENYVIVEAFSVDERTAELIETNQNLPQKERNPNLPRKLNGLDYSKALTAQMKKANYLYTQCIHSFAPKNERGKFKPTEQILDETGEKAFLIVPSNVDKKGKTLPVTSVFDRDNKLILECYKCDQGVTVTSAQLTYLCMLKDRFGGQIYNDQKLSHWAGFVPCDKVMDILKEALLVEHNYKEAEENSIFDFSEQAIERYCVAEEKYNEIFDKANQLANTVLKEKPMFYAK